MRSCRFGGSRIKSTGNSCNWPLKHPRGNGKEHGSYYSILGFILGIMDKKMEATIYSILGFILGIMEKKMETTIA